MCIALTETDYTTQEYLERVRHKGNLFLSPADLAISCLKLLSFDGFRKLWDDPQRNYAVRGWGEHSRGFDHHRDVMKYAVELLCDNDKVKLLGNIGLRHYTFPGWGDRCASALHLYSFFGLKHIADRLLQNKQDPNLQDRWGQRPLHYAACYGHEQVVKTLTETGKVDTDARDNDHRTPLSWAAQKGYEGVVKLLLETGRVDVDVRDKSDRTPLSWAAENGQEEVVKLLLETGKVAVDVRDKSDRTPLSWAAQNGHDGMVKLLLESRSRRERSTVV